MIEELVWVDSIIHISPIQVVLFNLKPVPLEVHGDVGLERMAKEQVKSEEECPSNDSGRLNYE